MKKDIVELDRPGDRFALAVGAGAVLVGGLVLAGWALDIAGLKSIRPDWVAMKPNTAVAFILIGLAVLFSRPRSTLNAQLSTSISLLGGLLAGLIGLLSLAEYMFNWNLGFDQRLFPEGVGAVGTSNPGRMAPETAVCFVLLATALWIISGSRKTQRAMLATTIFGLLVMTFAIAAILSYFTPTLGAFGWWGLTIMAVPTAATFAVLGSAVMLLTWQEGVWSWALSKWTTAAFAVGLTLFMVIGLNTSRSVVRLNETNRWVTHTEQVLRTMAGTQAAVAQAQNHTRGYVITGDQRMLEAQQSAAVSCQQGLDTLRQLIADNPGQQQKLSRLETQMKEALQWFQSVIDASRTGMTDATRREMVGHGQGLTDNLRATFQSMENVEHTLFQQRTREAEGVARHAYLIISTGTFTSLVIFLAVLFGLNRAEATRKVAERALRETNEYLENLFNYANAPIIVWDAAGKITRFNQAFEEIAGRKAEQVLGKGLDWLFAEDQRERAMGLVQRAGAGERFDLVEVPIHHPSGSQRTVLWNSAPIFGADKSKQIATIAQGQDISERKQADEALRASEFRYRRLFEAAKDGVLILDAETGMVLDVNPFLVDLLGFSHEEFLGKKVWELGFLKDIVANQANFAELQQKEYIRYENLALETSTGRRIEVEFTSNVYLVNHQKVIQCDIRDITARKQAEAALAAKMEELRRLQAATLGREGRVLELKREINALRASHGEPPKYPSVLVEGEK